MPTIKVGDDELPLFRLDTAPIGQRVVVIEAIEDEYRWKHFTRRELAEGEPLFMPKYLPVTSHRLVQGRLGKKPRHDPGEYAVASQMPGATLVVDAVYVNHDWTDAFEGVAVVEMMTWMGVYVNSKLVWRGRPVDLTVVKAIIGAMEDMPMAIFNAEHNPKIGVLPNDLTRLKLVEPYSGPTLVGRIT